MATALRSLPGFTFETVTPPLDEALPRMDVAVFVGFAASGPVNVPVAVEQAAEFDDIFGPEVILSWDLARGAHVNAHLRPAVHAFFRNGGRRCWVVRVANRPISNTFLLPDLRVWSAERPGMSDAIARARSEGTWSDRIEAATLLRRQGLRAIRLARDVDALTIELTGGASLERRDLLRLTFGANRHRAFAVVNTLTPHDDGRVTVELSPVLWFADQDGDFTRPDPPPPTFVGTSPPLGTIPLPTLVELLHIDLLARQDGAEPLRLERLGLVKGHSRFWGALPVDRDFFLPWADPMAHGIANNRRPAITPRFPLAGVDDAAGPVDVTVPMFDRLLPNYSGPRAVAITAAAWDGLEHFDASLFLDGRLQGTGMGALMGMAESIKYQSSTVPLMLEGIHAALFIDEATLIAVPDAVHRTWTAVKDTVRPPSSETLPAEVAPPDRCAPAPPFSVCDPCDLRAPLLYRPEVASTITLMWDAVARATQYIVEEAAAPEFKTWHQVATTAGTRFDIYSRPPGQYAFRVRAANASQTSLASEGHIVSIAFRPRAILDADGYTSRSLLEVQRALLHMCAARGDMVAVLALPEAFREADALTHVNTLTAGSIEPALSYGAIYHPWLIGSDGPDGTLRRTPPDGAATGIIARRALARGAWVAPANEPIRGVVALTPPLRRDARSRRELLTAQLNVITQEPAGFMTLSADTLSRDVDLRPLNVRRLLILLRRRALQVGSRYVFEPNGPALVRLVQRGFEEMLARLYERGAFQGATTASAYQVVVDSGLNTSQSRDAGRFMVELRVAPSWPLTFLRVRLLQRGDRLLVAEER